MIVKLFVRFTSRCVVVPMDLDIYTVDELDSVIRDHVGTSYGEPVSVSLYHPCYHGLERGDLGLSTTASQDVVAYSDINRIMDYLQPYQTLGRISSTLTAALSIIQFAAMAPNPAGAYASHVPSYLRFDSLLRFAVDLNWPQATVDELIAEFSGYEVKVFLGDDAPKDAEPGHITHFYDMETIRYERY